MYSLLLHVELIFIFSINFYALYFLNLFIVMYILYRKFSDFSFMIFFLHIAIVLAVINLEIYNELLFELYLWLNILDKVPHINSEVIYALTAVHILLLINLKRFENFWAIIDKKLSRN
ncbi:MAG: hypothetical protein L3J19_08130 [Sulfurimonas sp.]|nr:hypothetical protein [Sulfurimonas sp.]